MRSLQSSRLPSGREIGVRRRRDDDDRALDDELHIVVQTEDVHEIEGQEEDQEASHRSPDAAPTAFERRSAQDDRRTLTNVTDRVMWDILEWEYEVP